MSETPAPAPRIPPHPGPGRRDTPPTPQRTDFGTQSPAGPPLSLPRAPPPGSPQSPPAAAPRRCPRFRRWGRGRCLTPLFLRRGFGKQGFQCQGECCAAAGGAGARGAEARPGGHRPSAPGPAPEPEPPAEPRRRGWRAASPRTAMPRPGKQLSHFFFFPPNQPSNWSVLFPRLGFVSREKCSRLPTPPRKRRREVHCFQRAERERRCRRAGGLRGESGTGTVRWRNSKGFGVGLAKNEALQQNALR